MTTIIAMFVGCYCANNLFLNTFLSAHMSMYVHACIFACVCVFSDKRTSVILIYTDERVSIFYCLLQIFVLFDHTDDQATEYKS